jgi:TRAP-type uncharacterized transport system substrate-binding protein
MTEANARRSALDETPERRTDRKRWREDETLHGAMVRLARENRSLTFFMAILFLPLLGAAIYFTITTLLAPKHLSVGVLKDTPDAAVIAALRDVLPKTKEKVRPNVSTFGSARDISSAIEQRKLDMGILRSDLSIPTNGRSVVNLREISVAFAALASAESKDIRGLAGKSVLVLSALSDAADFTASLLAGAGVKEPVVTATTSSEEAGRLLKSGKAAAIAIVDAPERGYTRRVWRNVSAPNGNKVELLPIIQVAELSTTNPGFTEDKVAAKSIATKPAFPEEEVIVLKAGYLLIARMDVDRSYIASLAETLYARRVEISRTAPSINSIKTIDNEYVTSSLIPVHDGALDYFRREQMSFYDRYSDIIWLFIFYGGSVFSGIAWMGQSMFRTQRERERNLLRELSSVLAKIDGANDEEQIATIARETEDLVSQCMALAHRGQLGQKRLTAFSLGYSAIQSALQRKREELAGTNPGRKETLPGLN